MEWTRSRYAVQRNELPRALGSAGILFTLLLIFQYIQQIRDLARAERFPTQQQAILGKAGLVAIAKFAFAKQLVSLPLPLYIGTTALNRSFARNIKPLPIGKNSWPSPLAPLFYPATGVVVDEFKLAIPQHPLDEQGG